ncbi:MAG: RidA family protein [Candidatus Omnitrophica bacterium]|nr:RidA family protein [Candidatus Omnitrophota bacterium]
MTLDQTLLQACSRLGLKVPSPSKPVGVYRPMVVSGNFAYLSGQLSKDADGKLMVGKVGKDLTVEEGKKAAQLAALQATSLIHGEVGLDRVEQVVRLVGFVQSAENFYGQSDVINGASEFIVEILGEKGRHARTSIGVVSLPLNAAVELELTLRLR